MISTVKLATDIAEILQVRAAAAGDSVDHIIDRILREKLVVPKKVDGENTKSFRVEAHDFGAMLIGNRDYVNYNHLNDELETEELLQHLIKDRARS